MRKKNRSKKNMWLWGLGLVGVLVLGLIVYAIASALPQPDRFYGEGEWIVIQHAEDLGGEARINEIVEAMQDWTSVYGDCGRKIFVRPLEEKDQKVENFQSGKVVERFEYAIMGEIYMSNQDIAYDLALHSMTHACIPNEKHLNPPWQYRDGDITGIDGLSLQVLPRGQPKNGFQLFEEAAAELLAVCAAPTRYHPANDPRYTELLHLIQESFDCNNAPGLAKLLQTNDMETFLQIVLWLPANYPVGENEITAAMTKFQIAYNRGMDALNNP